jgi:hypothetical protein
VIGNSPTSQPIVATADPNLSNNVKSIITTLQDADIERHAFLEIRDRLDRELVTVIEVLSPTNKRYGPDREQYLLKQSAMMFVPTGWKPMPHQLGAVRLLLGNFEHQLAKILAIE